MRPRLRLPLFLLVAWAPALAAQADTDLDRIDALIAAHRYEAAREALTTWWSREGEAVAGDRRAKALYLRAVLAVDLAAAERDLLRVSVEHPQSPHADGALWRLAQSRAAHGDSAAAATYLERLVRDHPQSPHRAEAAQRLGVAVPVAPRVPPTAASTPAPTQASRVERPRATSAAAARRSEYVVQLGSFASVAEAEARRDALRAAGFRPVLARIGRSNETVVRVGPFRERAEADGALRRLRSAGFEAELITLGGP